MPMPVEPLASFFGSTSCRNSTLTLAVQLELGNSAYQPMERQLLTPLRLKISIALALHDYYFYWPAIPPAYWEVDT